MSSKPPAPLVFQLRCSDHLEPNLSQNIQGAIFQHPSFNASGTLTTLSLILESLLLLLFPHGILDTRVFMCLSLVSLFTGFVHRSAVLVFVLTHFTARSWFATRSCIHRYLVCTCRNFPKPRLADVPLAADESL